MRGAGGYRGAAEGTLEGCSGAGGVSGGCWGAAGRMRGGVKGMQGRCWEDAGGPQSPAQPLWGHPQQGAPPERCLPRAQEPQGSRARRSDGGPAPRRRGGRSSWAERSRMVRRRAGRAAPPGCRGAGAGGRGGDVMPSPRWHRAPHAHPSRVPIPAASRHPPGWRRGRCVSTFASCVRSRRPWRRPCTTPQHPPAPARTPKPGLSGRCRMPGLSCLAGGGRRKRSCCRTWRCSR